MVNNATHPSLTLDPFDGVNRFIRSTHPLYDLNAIKSIATSDQSIHLVTQDCIDNVADLGWDTTDVAKVIESLIESDYHQSEWCCCNGNIHRPCDSYTYKRFEYIEHAKKDMQIEYFLKFATTQNNKLLLMVSCHT